MFNLIRSAGVAALLATAPSLASAATFNGSNDVQPGGGPYDVMAQAFEFGVLFDIGDSGNVFTFTFTNSSPSSTAIVVTGAGVQQATAEFTGGVTFDFSNTAGIDITFSQGETDAAKIETTLAAGESTLFTVIFGTVVDNRGRGGKPGNGVGNTGIQFTIEGFADGTVPLPASGLLLIGGLGGLAALRRRRKAA